MKPIAGWAIAAALLAGSVTTPAHAGAGVAAGLGKDVAESIIGAIEGEGASEIFGSIFGGSGPDPLTQDQVADIVHQSFDGFSDQTILSAQGYLSDSITNYDPSSASPADAKQILDTASNLIGTVGGNISENTAEVAIPGYMAAQSAKIAFRTERARLTYIGPNDPIEFNGQIQFDRYGSGRISTDYPQPTELDAQVPLAVIEGLTTLKTYLGTIYSDHGNRIDTGTAQKCLYKTNVSSWLDNYSTTWVFGGKVVQDSGYLNFDTQFCYPFVDARSTTVLANGTKKLFQAPINAYQFMVRAEDGKPDFFLLQAKNEEFADIIRNFHVLTKRTDTFGNIEEMALSWIDLVVAYKKKFGPNVPAGSTSDAADSLVLEAFKQATYLGVDQYALHNKAIDANAFDYLHWFNSKAPDWGIVNGGELVFLARPSSSCSSSIQLPRSVFQSCFMTFPVLPN